MEPEQEALSIVSFKDWEAASPVNKLNSKKSHVKTPAPYKLSKQWIRRYSLTSDSNKVIKDFH